MNAKVGELFQDKEFCQKIYPMSFEEVKQEIEANGGEITMEELKEIAEEARQITVEMQENGGELNDEELAAVAGGRRSFVRQFAKCLVGSVGGYLLGGYPGAFVGAFYMATR